MLVLNCQVNGGYQDDCQGKTRNNSDHIHILRLQGAVENIRGLRLWRFRSALAGEGIPVYVRRPGGGIFLRLAGS